MHNGGLLMRRQDCNPKKDSLVKNRALAVGLSGLLATSLYGTVTVQNAYAEDLNPQQTNTGNPGANAASGNTAPAGATTPVADASTPNNYNVDRADKERLIAQLKGFFNLHAPGWKAKIQSLKNLTPAEKQQYIQDIDDQLQNSIDNIDNASSKQEAELIAGVDFDRLGGISVKAIEDDKITIFNTKCYGSELTYDLRPWNRIFEQIYKYIAEHNIILPTRFNSVATALFPFLDLGTYNEDEHVKINNKINPLAAENALSGILDIISHSKKLIFYFDDIQWIDDMSLNILKNLIVRNDSILFIMNIRIGYNNI